VDASYAFQRHIAACFPRNALAVREQTCRTGRMHKLQRRAMFGWIAIKKDESELFVESTDVEELRARRVWQFLLVTWSTWIVNSLFLWYRGYEVAALVCLIDSLVHLVIVVSLRNHANYRRIMNLNLIASGIGLFSVSVSDPAMAVTMLYCPVSIVVASQVVGVRAAFYWLVTNLGLFVLFYAIVYGIHDTFYTSRFDELLLVIGVAVCTFFCCQQGEAYYQRRIRNLITLSQDLEKKSETLRHLATTDALTGLINRFQFQERLREIVTHARAGSERMALFLLDMDGFKEINDTLGHPVGDKTLVEIAARLSAAFADCSDVARLGGDEFCIIYPQLRDAEQAESIASDICKVLTRRYVLDEVEFPLGVSVGYALCPDHAKTDCDLLAFADTAMFHAKEHRLGHACYEAEMTNRLVEYRKVQEHLSHALERNEFFLVYQPQVNVRTEEVTGVEALLRWRHDGEVIPPYRFIQLLEESGEIIPVGKWIVHEACRQLAEWTRAGYDVKISINISTVQFRDEEFCQSLADSVEEWGVDAVKLDIEVTEGLLIDDIGQAVTRLNAIKEMGISISIDDFGTGYSSFAYLRQLPIDRLKIDRAFIKDIPEADDGQIASTVIVLAKALGLGVLAEGVETEAQLAFLKEHDCDEYQGFYLSRPVSADQVVEHFSRRTPCTIA
jgi:diguanylate cyclase (GGDEF)-like protein